MISVIIPSYNSADSIGQLLDSIYMSEFKDFEVLVVDDNSADSSIDIIRSYPAKLVNLDENGGPANARNIGAKFAKGDILFFLALLWNMCILGPDQAEVIL